MRNVRIISAICAMSDLIIYVLFNLVMTLVVIVLGFPQAGD